MYNYNDNNNFISRGYHNWHWCQSNIWSSNTKQVMFVRKQSLNYLQYIQRVRCLRTSSLLRAGYPTLTHLEGRYDLSWLKTSKWYQT